MTELASPQKASANHSFSGLEVEDLLIFNCSPKGVILDVPWNTLNPNLEIKPNQLLISLVDKNSRSKVMNFILELQKSQVVHGWEIIMMLDEQPNLVYLHGLNFEEGMLLIGSSTNNIDRPTLMELSNTYSNRSSVVREIIRKGNLQNQQGAPDTAAFDNLSALNNELVNTQRQLAQKNAELIRLTEQKNRFLGMAAHDLRNPLSLILNFSKFILEDAGAQLEEEHLDYLAIIHNQSEFMLDLVNNFLDVSTIESVGMKFNKSVVELKPLISQNFTRNQFLFQKKPIFLHLTCPEYLPPMQIDKSKIEQVLNNLLSNAAKFSMPNSNVFLTVALDDEKVTLSVQDEGPGIPPDEQDKLFKPFSQTSVTSTAGEASTGLGLLITKQIVDGHGGQIWVESEVGKGTSFHFSLPLDKAEQTELPGEETAVSADPPPTAKAITDSTRSTFKILVADDSQINQKMLVHMLARLGHDTAVASSGLAVLAALKKERFDIVMMDVHMPELDGIEATRQIRQTLPADSQPVIIATSGSTATEEINYCLKAGMDDAISKPIRRNDLLAALERTQQRLTVQ